MVTMSDIARRAGVSRVTASFVLNGRIEERGISEQAQQQVHDAARELGYRPNGLARAMATGKSRVLAFVTYSPHFEHTMQMLVGASAIAQAQGYLVKTIFLQPDEAPDELLARCVEERVAGVLAVVLPDAMQKYLHQEMSRYDIPVAIIESTPPARWGIHVGPDEKMAMRQIVRHLAGLGHRRIALISGDDESPALLREKFFLTAMRAAKIPVESGLVIKGGWNPQLAEQATLDFLALGKKRPTAIIGAHDAAAMVAIRAARGLGLQVPRDLSVVGIGDFMMAALCDPPLSSVQFHCTRLGQTATQCLLEQLEQKGKPEPVRQLLPTELVVRASTAPPPQI